METLDVFRLKINWQRNFFDHRIRNKQMLLEKTAYILANPVRAGLVEREQDWPYTWMPAEG